MVLWALVDEIFPLRVPECNGSVGWLSTAALHNILNQNLGGSFVNRPVTPPLWRDLVNILMRKPKHASSFSLKCADFKNVIFEKNPLAPSEVAEVTEVIRP